MKSQLEMLKLMN